MTVDGQSTSRGLLQRSQQNDREAWNRLVELYGPLVYEWCRRWGLSAEDAADVGQETFLRVARQLSTFRRDRPGDTFRGWLRCLAHSSYVDFLRRRETVGIAAGGSDALARLQQIAAPALTDSAALAAETRALYARAVELIRQDFSDRDWKIFEAVVMYGRSPQDVAAETRVAINRVYLAKSRILRRLKDEFGDVLPNLTPAET